MYSILALNAQNRFDFLGSAPDPAGRAYVAPSCLGLLAFGNRASNFHHSHVLLGTPAPKSQFSSRCSFTQFLEPPHNFSKSLSPKDIIQIYASGPAISHSWTIIIVIIILIIVIVVDIIIVVSLFSYLLKF